MAVVERVHDAAPQIFAGPGGAQPLAFDAEERDFVEGIDHAQARVEFQAVDDADRIADPNMFGAQVAMAVDDVARSHALGQKLGPFGQEAALHGVDVAHRPDRQVKARVEKNTAIIGEAAPELRGVHGGRDEHGAGAAIELHKHGRQAVELPAMQTPVRNHAVQHLALVETVHDHEPVDDLAGAADGEALRRTLKRNDVTIDVGSETAIELELGPASRLAAGKRREIKIGETDRFFQLVDPIAGKKHLRHVGFVTGHLGHGRPIGVAPRQEFDLVGERWLGRRNRLRSGLDGCFSTSMNRR